MRLKYIVLLGLLGASVAALVALRNQNSQCQSRTLSSHVSPDGARTALIQDEVCNAGSPFTVVVRAKVRLSRRGEEATGGRDVYAMDYSGSPENLPAVEWLSADRLQIFGPSLSLIPSKESRQEGVEIVIKYF